MSQEPKTNFDDTPAGTDSDLITLAADRRFTENPEVLDIERQLVADGATLPNRAIPFKYHPSWREYDDPQEIRSLIEAETDKDNPNKQLIGLLNEQL